MNTLDLYRDFDNDMSIEENKMDAELSLVEYDINIVEDYLLRWNVFACQEKFIINTVPKNIFVAARCSRVVCQLSAIRDGLLMAIEGEFLPEKTDRCLRCENK